MLEVYNEEIKDLLGRGPPTGQHPFHPSLCPTLGYLTAYNLLK